MIASQEITEDIIATRRRSKRSASVPPYSPITTIGASAMPAINETAKVDEVMAYTCKATVTTVIS